MKTRLQMVLLAIVACQSNPKISGQEIGTFTFSASPVANDCPFQAVPPADPNASFSFDGILSRDPQSTKAFFRVGDVERDAGFDGQVFDSEATAPRHFIECSCDPVTTDETMRVALLSSSQDDAVGHVCPPNPLDGGVPVGGGTSPPCPTADACNVVRACGDLVDVIRPGSGCQCLGCSVSFQVEGRMKTSQP
jgi:hypothetical protein